MSRTSFLRALLLLFALFLLLCTLASWRIGLNHEDDVLLRRVQRRLNARGLHVARPANWQHAQMLVEQPLDLSGPSARAELSALQLSVLERAVRLRMRRPLNGICPAAAQMIKLYKDAIERGVRLHSTDDNAAAIVIAGKRGRRYARVLHTDTHLRSLMSKRKLCTFQECFDARRPACMRKGPMRVLWYAHVPHGSPPGTKAVAARTLADVSCGRRNVTPCPWVLDGLRSAGKDVGPLVELTSNPDDACVFVLTKDVLTKMGDARCPSVKACAHKFDVAAYWSAAGGPGRNHMIVQPNSIFSGDDPGEYNAFGDSGESFFVCTGQWWGHFRPGFDINTPMRFTGIMGKLAEAEPDRGWWGDAAVLTQGHADARAEPVKITDRPLLLTFRGTVTSRRGWFRARLIAQESAHDPRHGVHVFVWDKRKGTVVCGRQESVDMSTAAATAGARRAAVEALAGNYSRMIAASTFGFAPGGSAPSSFRFFELMAAGSVPVTPDNLLTPWYDAVLRPQPWDECVVRASRAELFALGDLVRAVSPPGSNVHKMRKAACSRAWAELSGQGYARRAAKFLPHVRLAEAAQIAYDCAGTAHIWLELRARIEHTKWLPFLRRNASSEYEKWMDACVFDRVRAYSSRGDIRHVL